MTWLLDEFFAPLQVEEVTIALGGVFQSDRSLSGEWVVHQLGERLWGGTVTLADRAHADQAAVEAVISRLEDPTQRFLIYDTRLQYPPSDLSGAALGSASVQIASLPSGNRTITLSGLPAGYQLPPGTWFSFTYLSNPVRHALHRVVRGGEASGGGVSPVLEVSPAIRPGAQVGLSVRLHRARCKARLIGASYGGGRRTLSAGPSFSWQQTFG